LSSARDPADVVHLAGAVEVPPGAPERELLRALGGRLVVMVGAGEGGSAGPYALISHSGAAPVPCVSALGSVDPVAEIAPQGTKIAMTASQDPPAPIQLQLGPLSPGALGDGPGPAVEVVTLVLSVELGSGGEATFIGQSIGGWAG
jgi:hypothetical protein